MNLPLLPDFDALTIDELMDFWMKYSRPKRADAKALVGYRKGYIGLSQDLACLAVNKATFISCRDRGDEFAADIYERYCRNIIRSLPEDIRLAMEK